MVAAVLSNSPPHPVNRAAMSGSRYLDVDMDPRTVWWSMVCASLGEAVQG